MWHVNVMSDVMHVQLFLPLAITINFWDSFVVNCVINVAVLLLIINIILLLFNWLSFCCVLLYTSH